MFRRQWWLVALALLGVGGWLSVGERAGAQRAPAAGPGAAGGGTRPGPAAEGAGGPAAPAVANELAIMDREGRRLGACPLKHTSVEADVAGFVARVNVTQQFENPSREPVEAVYTFPLPEDAAVDDMTMSIGSRVIQGEIRKREEARAIYEAARAAGQAAALLDQERPNIFTQSIANLMPGEPVRITISYVQLVKHDEGRYEWVFPMVVGPRYTGRSDVGTDGPPRSPVRDAERITPPITPAATRAGHDLSLRVNLDAGFPLRETASVLHSIVTEPRGEGKALVRLKVAKTIPNQDFILRYRVAGDRMQTGLLAHGKNGSGSFALVLQPPQAPAPKDIAPKEMVFVIDQTGSQRGLPIAKAKETMRHCIENLNEGDTFQLLGFNTALNPCFPRPVPVTAENLQKAWKFLEPIEGDGGTDILKAVDHVLNLPPDAARPRIVCYMTDGYVGNDFEILAYIRKHRGNARLFPFGVGNSVNRFLIDGMAKEGRGVPEYVSLREEGTQAAARFYARVAKPLLLDVAVEWNGLPVADVYPKAIPDLFSSGPVILKGRYTKAAAGEITLKGLLRGKPWAQRIPVAFPANREEGAALPTLWARARLEDLMAEDYLGAQAGHPTPEIQEKIVNLALDYRLMSQYTSFVAVEERVVNVGGRQRRIDVPVEMPEGVSYEGIFGREAEQLSLLGVPALGRSAGGRGAFGAGYGGAGGFRGAPAAGGVPAPAARPAVRARVLASQPAGPREARGESLKQLADLAGADGAAATFDLNTDEARKALAELKPEERQKVYRLVKLAAPLHDLAAKVAKEGREGTLLKPGLPEVERGRVLVQVWVEKLPEDALKQLAALGFKQDAVLIQDRVLLGTLPLERLQALLELPFVRRVEPPRFR
jgi:Ca-activated chloride channel family protein